MKTIDLTPTWRGLMPALIEVAARGDSAEGRKYATEQLLELASVVDRMNAEAKAERSALRFVVTVEMTSLDEVKYTRTVLVLADTAANAMNRVYDHYRQQHNAEPFEVQECVMVNEVLP